MKRVHPYSKNQVLTGQVIDLTHEGLGVVKIDHYPFFIPDSLPGEFIEFKVVKTGKKFAYGKLLKLIEASPDRVDIRDDLGRQNGSLTLQHLAYPAQLAFKAKLVRDNFERIGHFKEVQVQSTWGMADPWGYRNKAQIPVQELNGQLETGFYRKNSHDLIPVEDFQIQDPRIDQVIRLVRDRLRYYQIPAYDEKTHQGVIRHVIVKRGYYSGQIMVVLVTRQRDFDHKEALVADLIKQIDGLVSLMQSINPKRTNVILGDQTVLLWGQAYYEDQMLGMTFRIAAQSFYQVNTPQAERMYEEVVRLAQLDGTQTVLDAYCGIGTISLALAQSAKKVYAMEIVPAAVEMARMNAQLNGIDRAVFEVGKAEDWLAKWNQAGIHFDVVVVDPPRKGLDPSFVQALIQQDPDRIVYVSCNPSTQARDCQLLNQAGYEIRHIQPVDLFPQTVHVECVVLLQREIM